VSLEKSPYQLEYEFLSYLAKAGGPVGATTLVLVLGKTFSLSHAAADAMTGHIDQSIQDVYRYYLSQREETADNGADR